MMQVLNALWLAGMLYIAWIWVRLLVGISREK
jgi:hypothetical protein